jgi:septal ring factor EnvC (AmiA/AmiB activator)
VTRFVAFTNALEFHQISAIEDLEDIIVDFASGMKQVVVFSQVASPEIIDFARTKEFVFILSPENLSKVYMQLVKTTELGPEQCSTAHARLLDQLRLRMHVALALPPEFPFSDTAFCYNLSFGLNDKSALEATARDIFDQNKNLPVAFPHAVATIHWEFGRNDNQFFDFLEEILRETNASFISTASLQQMGEQSLLFLKRLTDQKEKDLVSIENLSQELSQMSAEREAKQAELQEGLTEVNATLEKYENEVGEMEQSISQSSTQITEMNDTLIELLARVEEFRVLVNDIDAKGIDLVRNFADSPPPKFRSLMEIIAAYLQQTPNYDEAAKAVLLDPALLDNLRTQISHETITSEVLEHVNPIFERERFAVQEFEELTPVCVTLYQWANALHNYGLQRHEIKEAQQDMEMVQQSLDDYKKTNAELFQKATDSKVELQASLDELENTKAQGSDLQSRKEFLDKRVALTLDVFAATVNFGEHHRENQLIGLSEIPLRSLLSSAYLLYCGSLTQADRERFLRFVAQQIAGLHEDLDLIETVSVKIAASDSGITRNAGIAAIEGRFLWSLSRAPLITDGDGFIRTYIDGHSSKVLQCSMLSPNLDKVIIQAVLDGVTLVIYDWTEMTPLLENLLRIYNARGTLPKNKKVTIAKSEIPFSPDFRLFVFTQEPFNHPRFARINMLDIGSRYSDDLIRDAFMKGASASHAQALKILQANPLCIKAETVARYQKMAKLLSDLEKHDEKWDEDATTIKELSRLLEICASTEQQIKNCEAMAVDVGKTLTDVESSIKTAQLLWKSVSRYFSISRFFELKAFIGIIEHSFTRRQKPMEELLKFISATIPFNYLIGCLFVSLNQDPLDLAILGDRFFDHKQRTSGNPSEITSLLKVRFSDLFDRIFQIITNHFGEVIIPPFLLDAFVASNCVLIFSNLQTDIAALLIQFMTIRNRLDSFALFILSEDITDTDVRELRDSLMKAFWVAVVYTKPSLRAASVIALIVSEIHTASKLIVLASTTEYLPDILFEKATIFAYQSYPSVRNQMIQLYQHFSVSIRSTVDSGKMKRICFLISLLYSVLNFRASIKPSGFFNFPPINEIIMKDIFETVRSMIDNVTFYPRNLRDSIQENFFGNAVLDTFDRRKLRGHIYTVMSGALDQTNLVDATSPEDDLWKFPPDAPIANYFHFFEAYPQFPSLDLLYFDPASSSAVRGWNLGDWLSPVFLELRRKPTTPPISIQSRLPSLISLNDRVLKTPFDWFVFAEIERFNSALKEIISSGAMITNPESIPKHWCDLMCFSYSTSLDDFMRFISEKREFLDNFVITSIIDVKYINDLHGLFVAFQADSAITLGIPMDGLDLGFNIGGSHANSMKLSGVHLIGGLFRSGLVRSISKTPNIVPLPIIACYTVPKVPKSQLYMCPMFRTPQVAEFTLPSDMKRIDGELENFIIYVPVASKLGERFLVANGTSFVCQIPQLLADLINDV